MFNPWILLGALVMALGLFLTGHHIGVKNTSLNYENAIKGQKLEAAKILAKKVQENADLAAKWTAYARGSDNEYAKQIADIRARANVAGGLRINVPRCGESGGSTPTAAAGNSRPPETGATAGELLQQLVDMAAGQATAGDEIAAYAQSCYRFVNEK